jgi:orotate phosphoribosyltransferase
VEEALDERYESWLLGELARLEVRREGHFRLPSGLHTDTYFQSEMLLRYPDILTRLAEEMFRRVFTCSPTTLLSYSLLGLQLAAQLADLFAREGYDVRQSPASGYPDPLPRLADTVHERDRIAIITDVVSSGNAVGALREFARAKAATVVAAICVVDTNSIGERLPLEPLAKCEALSFQTAQECELCQKGTAYQEIDPYTSAVLPTMPARQTAPTALDSTAFWTMAHKCAAVRRGHFSSNGHHFSLFVETARILRDESNIRMITDLARATPDYDDVKAVVHPVHESAMILGREIGSSLEAIAIPAHRRPDAHEYIIAPDYAEDLRARAPGKVLLVDDGANFGSTLLGMHYAVTRFLEYHKIEGYSLAACVLLDRLNGFYAELVREKFGSRFRALYSLKSPPVYHHADCPICRRNDFLAVRMRTAAKEIREQYEEELKANAVVFLDVGLREAADRGLSR